MTTDLIQCMEEGDCMCISLDIWRSEACMDDPTRLVIKDIIPTFISADGFLESATYHLQKI